MTRKYLYASFFFAGIVLAIWFGFWVHASNVMKNAVAQFAAAQVREDIDVTYASIKTSGYPFLLRGHIKAPSVRLANGDHWSADKLYVDTSITSPNRLIFSPRGVHQLMQHNGGRWTVEDDTMHASIESLPKSRWLAKMSGDQLQAATQSGNRLLVLNYVVNLQPSPHLPDALEASAILGPAALDGGSYEGRPIKITVIELAARLRAASIFATGNMDQWRAMGGIVEIERARLESAGAIIFLSGTLSIDDQGFPSGRLTASIDNPGKLGPLLTGIGQLSKTQAKAAQSTLLFVGLASGNKIEAPVEFENGYAKFLGVKIAQLPKIAGGARKTGE